MSDFNERLKAICGQDADSLVVLRGLFGDLHIALRQQFPLCHVDTNAIDETLLKAGEQVAHLRRCTAQENPAPPAVAEDPVAPIVESQPEPETPADSPAEAQADPVAVTEPATVVEPEPQPQPPVKSKAKPKPEPETV